MVYKVAITDTALAEAEDYIDFILSQSNDDQAAINWRTGLLEAVSSLQHLPRRCPAIPEQRHFKTKLHQLVYESHRIIFQVEPGLVTIVRIYHGAQRTLRTLKPRTRSKPRTP